MAQKVGDRASLFDDFERPRIGSHVLPTRALSREVYADGSGAGLVQCTDDPALRRVRDRTLSSRVRRAEGQILLKLDNRYYLLQNTR